MNLIFKSLAINFLLLIISFNNINGQCKPQIWSFQSGEELFYDIVYNWGFIWVDAGRVEFKVKKEFLSGKEVYHFSGAGISLPKHDWFYRVRDYYHSWAQTDDLKPIMYSRNTSEAKYQVKNYYNFDHLQKKIYTNTWNSKKKQQYDTIPMPDCLFDIMTAVYYARTIDLSKLSINEKVPITMIVDNEIFNLYGRYLGMETIKLRNNKNKLSCLKFSMLLVEGTMFKGGEDLTVWISDDKNRVPILVEAKVLVGSVKAYLKSTENLLQQKDYNASNN